jgi:plastocyanin
MPPTVRGHGRQGVRKFTPQTVTFQVGDTVEWTFVAGTHSSTAGTPGAPVGIWGFRDFTVRGFVFFRRLLPHPALSHTFAAPTALCAGMIGSVTVMAPTPTPTPTPPLPLIQKRQRFQMGVQTVATGLTAPVELSGAGGR